MRMPERVDASARGASGRARRAALATRTALATYAALAAHTALAAYAGGENCKTSLQDMPRLMGSPLRSACCSPA